MKKNKFTILFFSSLLLIAIISGGVFAWYSSNNTETETGLMGNISTTIVDNSSAKFMSSGLVDGVIKKSFSVSNSSNIDSFIRIGYTPIFKDADDNDVLMDISDLEVSDVLIKSGDSELKSSVSNVTTSTGYTKKFIVPVSNIDGKYYYYKLAPGENLTGSISVKTNVSDDSLTADLVISAETIQATEKALVDAGSYGWDKAFYK